MSEGWLKLYAAGVTGLFILATAVAAIMWPDANVERQTDIQFVTIAIGILGEEVTDLPKQKPLREWAIGIINEHSKVEIDAAARQALLEDAWPFKVYKAFPLGGAAGRGLEWNQLPDHE